MAKNDDGSSRYASYLAKEILENPTYDMAPLKGSERGSGRFIALMIAVEEYQELGDLNTPISDVRKLVKFWRSNTVSK